MTVLIFGCTSRAANNDQKKIGEIVMSMSLKEKAQLVVGTGMHFELPEGVNFPGVPRGPVDPNDSVYSKMVTHIRTFVPGAAGNSSMFAEKGVTTQVLADGGNSVVDVLSGKVNPLGKLAITFPVKYEDGPSASTFPGHATEGETGTEQDLSGFSFMSRVPWEITYEEDIYVGYRYFTTFDVEVSYPFGYGLSYTSFEISDLNLSSFKFRDKISVSVKVKNTGKTAGREVVQGYLSAPGKSMEKPEIALVNFGKTKLLQPGETETLTFDIEATDLCSFDEARSSWVAEAGEYTLGTASSANDIRESLTYSVDRELEVETASNVLAPQVTIDKMTK